MSQQSYYTYYPSYYIGQTGATGPIGMPGATGVQGKKGVQGITGVQGPINNDVSTIIPYAGMIVFPISPDSCLNPNINISFGNTISSQKYTLFPIYYCSFIIPINGIIDSISLYLQPSDNLPLIPFTLNITVIHEQIYNNILSLDSQFLQLYNNIIQFQLNVSKNDIVNISFSNYSTASGYNMYINAAINLKLIK